ncbi:MAG: N-acetylmuramoyl-L-alanine amidase [Alphaproteobacteria bacterium]|nr:N-acetylmuramoyl-L-alanine amidase [Alphaproteobacteria bacterium]
MRAGLARVLALLIVGAPPLPGWADAVVGGLRIGEHGTITRFVLDLDAAVDYRIGFPAPNSARLELPASDWRVAVGDSGRGRGLIRYFALETDAAGTTVVLDMAVPARVLHHFLLPPQGPFGYRLVVDFVPGAAASALTETVNDEAVALIGTLRGPVPMPRPRRHVIVIDPGHGGLDPGAIGGAGTMEKDVALAVALEVRERLAERRRFVVVLTRERDIYLKLRDRVALARAAQGELFLSLHADSHRNAALQGASVYTLSETASDEEAAALAAKENRADIIAGVDLSHENPVVSEILIDLAQRETLNLSADFANHLLPELKAAAEVLRNSRRFAGFAVLKAPDMPSVLIELGYLSNRADEHRLSTPAGRAGLVEAIARAIDTYFSGQSE